jgi:hypothetical protein
LGFSNETTVIIRQACMRTLDNSLPWLHVPALTAGDFTIRVKVLKLKIQRLYACFLKKKTIPTDVSTHVMI